MESSKQRLYQFKRYKKGYKWYVLANGKRIGSQIGFFDTMAKKVIEDYFKYECRNYDKLKSIEILAKAFVGINTILPGGLDGFNMCGIVIKNLCEHAKNAK
jgi:hypothetical protein